MKRNFNLFAFTVILISSSCAVPAGEPAQLEQPFTPAVSAFAYRIVSEPFELVEDLRKVDPEVRGMFFKTVPQRSIATGSQPFAMTDIDDGLPRRFNFAGRAGNLWFVLYEVGGRAHHHVILIFCRDGKRWRHGTAAVGYLGKNTFPDLIKALKKGYFDVVFDNLNL